MDIELKTVLDGIAGSVQQFSSRIDQLQRQTDSLDLKLQGPSGHSGGTSDPLREAFEHSAEFARLREVGKGRAIVAVKDLARIETKTLISSDAVGSGSAGVLMPQRVGEIVPTAQRRLFLRDLLSRGNHITANAAFFIFM